MPAHEERAQCAAFVGQCLREAEVPLPSLQPQKATAAVGWFPVCSCGGELSDDSSSMDLDHVRRVARTALGQTFEKSRKQPAARSRSGGRWSSLMLLLGRIGDFRSA